MLTPVYHKTTPEWAWPKGQSAFYVLSRDGLLFCREHLFFRSCVPAPSGPGELAGQAPFLELKYPRLPRAIFERIIGFFSIVGEEHGGEAAVLLAWNTTEQRHEIIVPQQQSVVGGRATGQAYPIEVHYQIPPLPAGWLLIGDVHSHVDEAAYASATDKEDEAHRPGLHIVAGRLYREPPELHIEVAIDGFRFRVEDPSMVLEEYRCRRTREVPSAWLERVEIYSWGEYQQKFGKGVSLGSPVSKNGIGGALPAAVAWNPPSANPASVKPSEDKP